MKQERRGRCRSHDKAMQTEGRIAAATDRQTRYAEPGTQVMTAWILPVLIFLVWILWVAACAEESNLRSAKEGRPPSERPGTSILPGFPLFPLAFWGIAWVVDRFVEPWGTLTVGAFHAVFGAVLIVSIVRCTREIRAIDSRA